MKITGIREFMQGFWRREDGALIPLALQIFLAMMICIGITVDLTRQEELRVKLQGTVDRAALAAASLSQDLDPAFVVSEYINKAGFGYLGITPIVEEGSHREWRKVTINASENMMTIFGPLIGLDSMRIGVASTAKEAIGKVEISLVLDISGSMGDGSPTRMARLKTAATAFTDRMFANVQGADSPPGRLAISIVPYNQQVTLGSQVAAAYNLSTDHTQNTCADVQLLPTDQIGISPTAPLQRTMFGDDFDYFILNSPPPAYSNILNCQENAYASVLPFSNNRTAINTKINNLVANGDTAIDVGVRWGLAFLDPSAQPAVNTLISSGVVRSELSGLPKNNSSHGETSALKVLVLMTDGENTRSHSLKPAYRTGYSNTFFSTQSATAFGDSGSAWQNLYYYNPSYSYKGLYRFYTGQWVTAGSPQYPSTLYPITWNTIWSKGYSLDYTIERFFFPALQLSSMYTRTYFGNQMRIRNAYSEKDTALRALCDTAKAAPNNIIIYTIAVDAPPAGVTVLDYCASGAGYAYNVTAGNMMDAFASIAASVTTLRLTN